MILKLLRREKIEAPPNNVEDIVLGGVAIAQRYLNRGKIQEAYALVPQLERLYQHAGYKIEREVGINRLVIRIVGGRYDPMPDPNFPDAA